MWQAFVTGFSKQAAVDIEERNKDIKKQIQQSLINREKTNEEVRKKAEKEYSSRAEVARKASSLLSSAGLSKDEMENYLVAFVENPDRFTSFEEAVKEGRIGVDSVGDFVTLPKTQPEKRVRLEDVLGGFRARPAAGAKPADYSETRTAFGLRAGNIARAAETEAAVALGMSDEEKLGLQYETPAPKLDAQFNYSVLLKEKQDSIDKRINRASLAVLDADTEEKRNLARAELDRVLAVKSLQKQSESGSKESDIRANYRILNNTIMESMAGPGDLVRDTETGALMYSRAAKPEVRAKIEAQKRKAFMDSELTNSYRQSDGKLPPEVQRIISSFTYSSPAAAPTGGGGAPAPAPAPAPSGSPAPAAPAAAPAAAPTSEKQQTVENAKKAVAQINSNSSLSQGQKNGRISMIRDRLRSAGIDPKEAGL